MNPKLALLFALAAVSCFVLAGIFVAERSALGFVFSLIVSVFVIGFGFVVKKRTRLRNQNRA